MDRILTSKKGERVQFLKKLAGNAAQRRLRGSYLVDGARLVADALRAGAPLRSLLMAPDLAQSGAGRELAQIAGRAGVDAVLAEAAVLAHITGGTSSQGVLAELGMPGPVDGSAGSGLWLSLHGLQDPGNVGNALRAAAATGCAGVLLDRNCADPFGLKAVRAAAGALWQVPVEICDDMENRLESLKKNGVRLIGAVAQGGKSYLDEILSTPVCLMIGSEGHGLPENIRLFADSRVTIAYPGTIESLNASTSASLLLFECLRQRKTF
jgi:TrmH family RNA methyltransferase